LSHFYCKKSSTLSSEAVFHTVEKREILSHQIFFSSNQLLGTYLVKSLLSRNSCQKRMREDSRKRNFSVKTILLENWSTSLISRIIFWQCRNHIACIVEKWKIYSHQKIFRQINSFLVISLVKLSLSRNFCQKCVKITIFTLTLEMFREINFYFISYSKWTYFHGKFGKSAHDMQRFVTFSRKR